MNKFWELMAGKLADRWGAITAGALVFWSGGLLVLIYNTRDNGGVAGLVAPITRWPVVVQVMYLVGALLVVTASALVVRRLITPALALMQGPWRGLGFAHFSAWCAERAAKKTVKLELDWNKAANELETNPLPKQQLRYTSLDSRLRHRPDATALNDFLPTSLGNIVRAADCRVIRRYGLVPSTVWSRLWLVLPASTRDELMLARAALDSCVSTLIWSIGFACFGFAAWWAAPFGVAVALLTLAVWLPSRIAAFADLTESVFDLHRFALYEQLRLPPPIAPATECDTGNALTLYIFRGIPPEGVEFTSPAKEPKP